LGAFAILYAGELATQLRECACVIFICQLLSFFIFVHISLGLLLLGSLIKSVKVRRLRKWKLLVGGGVKATPLTHTHTHAIEEKRKIAFNFEWVSQQQEQLRIQPSHGDWRTHWLPRLLDTRNIQDTGYWPPKVPPPSQQPSIPSKQTNNENNKKWHCHRFYCCQGKNKKEQVKHNYLSPAGDICVCVYVHTHLHTSRIQLFNLSRLKDRH